MLFPASPSLLILCLPAELEENVTEMRTDSYPSKRFRD
jgi:hypothetical protein